MGRRKKATKKVVAKKRPIVPKVFKCPKCNHEDAVEVKLDKKTLLGDISCRICGANYQTRIHNLTDEVDVFCDWIDAFHAVNT